MYSFANGDKYEGAFKLDRFNGQGSYIYADGSTYVGAFKDGAQTGKATKTWGSKTALAGDKYIGDFTDDKQSGQGTYSQADGDHVRLASSEGEARATAKAPYTWGL